MSETRLFRLEWNYARNPNLNAAERFKERNTIGVHFHTGLVALSGGSGFNSMDELAAILKPYGQHTITYLDESSIDVKDDDYVQVS